jgi:hypothetical protein
LNQLTDLVKIAGQPTQEVEMQNIIGAFSAHSAGKLQGQPARRPWMSISTVKSVYTDFTPGVSSGDDASAR